MNNQDTVVHHIINLIKDSEAKLKTGFAMCAILQSSSFISSQVQQTTHSWNMQ